MVEGAGGRRGCLDARLVVGRRPDDARLLVALQHRYRDRDGRIDRLPAGPRRSRVLRAAEQRADLHDRLAQRLRAVPLLAGSSVTTSVPGAGAPPQWSFQQTVDPSTRTSRRSSRWLPSATTTFARSIVRSFVGDRSRPSTARLRAGSQSSTNGSRQRCSRPKTLSDSGSASREAAGRRTFRLDHDCRHRAHHQPDEPWTWAPDPTPSSTSHIARSQLRTQ